MIPWVNGEPILPHPLLPVNPQLPDALRWATLGYPKLGYATLGWATLRCAVLCSVVSWLSVGCHLVDKCPRSLG